MTSSFRSDNSLRLQLLLNPFPRLKGRGRLYVCTDSLELVEANCERCLRNRYLALHLAWSKYSGYYLAFKYAGSVVSTRRGRDDDVNSLCTQYKYQENYH